jgi:hypothetical protein
MVARKLVAEEGVGSLKHEVSGSFGESCRIIKHVQRRGGTIDRNENRFDFNGLFIPSHAMVALPHVRFPSALFS